MIAKVTVTFQFDTEEYDVSPNQKDVTDLVAEMLQGDADLPPVNDIKIEVKIE